MQLEDYFDFLAPDDIRIKGHRIGIESVLYEYLYRQQTPEDIVQRFPSLTLEQVYATILYYHQNKEQVDKYIADWLEFGRKAREEQARSSSPAVERMSRIKAERMAAERKTVDYQIHPPAPDEPMTQIALSLPDYVSQTAEQYARRLGVSPDEFYAAAGLGFEPRIPCSKDRCPTVRRPRKRYNYIILLHRSDRYGMNEWVSQSVSVFLDGTALQRQRITRRPVCFHSGNV